MFRNKPQDKRRTMGAIALVISLIPLGFGVNMAYHHTVVIPAEMQRFEQELEARERERTEQERRQTQEIEEYRKYLDQQGQ